MNKCTIFGTVSTKSDVLHADDLLELYCLLVKRSELHHVPLVFLHSRV